MARGRRRRRGRAIFRALFFVVAISWVLSFLARGGLHAGTWGPASALLMAPMALFGMVMAIPFMLLAFVLVVLALLIPLAILAAIFGGPFVLMYHVFGRGRSARRAKGDDTSAWPAAGQVQPAADVLLRRRYVAGELAYDQFQDEMMGLLKGRFARGELAVSEYERELERLLEPVRRLDVKGDPALAGPAGRAPRR